MVDPRSLRCTVGNRGSKKYASFPKGRHTFSLFGSRGQNGLRRAAIGRYSGGQGYSGGGGRGGPLAPAPFGIDA